MGRKSFRKLKKQRGRGFPQELGEDLWGKNTKRSTGAETIMVGDPDRDPRYRFLDHAFISFIQSILNNSDTSPLYEVIQDFMHDGGIEGTDACRELYEKGLLDKSGVYTIFLLGLDRYTDAAPLLTQLLGLVKTYVYDKDSEAQNCDWYDIPMGLPVSMGHSPVWLSLANYTIDMATEGHPLVMESLKYIYKKFYRQEYNTLKKFSILDMGNLEEFYLSNFRDGDNLFNMFTMARILAAADFLGITTEGCEPLYGSCLQTAYLYAASCDECDRYYDLMEDVSLEESLLPEADNYLFLLEEEIEKSPDQVAKAIELANIALNQHGLGDDLLFFDIDKGADPDGQRCTLNSLIRHKLAPQLLPIILAQMSNNESLSDESLDFDTNDWIFALLLDRICRSVKLRLDSFMQEDMCIAGTGRVYDSSMNVIWETAALSSSSSNDSDPSLAPGPASEEILRLKKEIADLRSQLQLKEEELTKQQGISSALAKNLRSEQWKREQLEKALSVISAQQDATDRELDAISGEEHSEAQVVSESATLSVSIDDMITELRKHRIVIIGGNQNWIKKISSSDYFPDWKYISKSASGNISDKTVAQAERVYFFTDTLSHQVYYRFSQACENYSVPIGYLHGVNMDRVISFLYNDLLIGD